MSCMAVSSWGHASASTQNATSQNSSNEAWGSLPVPLGPIGCGTWKHLDPLTTSLGPRPYEPIGPVTWFHLSPLSLGPGPFWVNWVHLGLLGPVGPIEPGHRTHLNNMCTSLFLPYHTQTFETTYMYECQLCRPLGSLGGPF